MTPDSAVSDQPRFTWPMEPPTVEDRAWSIRYSDPVELPRLVATMAPGPRRSVLEAFIAWREQRLDEALTITGDLIERSTLDTVWAPRIYGIQAAVLGELGLTEASLTTQLDELVEARRSGDPVALASITHDLGVTYQFSDPQRAQEQFLEAIRLARGFRRAPAHVARESCAIEALAIVNLHDLAQTYDSIELPVMCPTLDDAQALAERAWPDLAHAIRALRARPLVEQGRLAQARALVPADLDPASMRDVVNAVLVVEVQALILEQEGRDEEALGLLERALEVVPPLHRSDLLRTLVTIHERRGRYAEALRASKEATTCLLALHAEESRTAVRALEVWHRTRRAEEDARIAQEMADLFRERSRQDVLTGLATRQHLLDLLAQLGDGAGHQVALLDVDSFREINETAGRGVGDAVLRDLAAQLREICRAGDTVARFGDDEFVVVRPAGSPGLLVEDLQPLLRRPATGQVPALTMSVGVVRTGEQGFFVALDQADRLTYAARRDGGACLRHADPQAPRVWPA